MVVGKMLVWAYKTLNNQSRLPDPPSWNPNGLEGADNNLSHEDEEESHEVEGAICPKGNRWTVGEDSSQIVKSEFYLKLSNPQAVFAVL